MDNSHAHPSPSAIVPNRPRTLRDYNATPRTSSPPTRQQRLLRSRNAKFPAKKLSLSGISAKFSQLIRANEESSPVQATLPVRKENIGSKRVRGSAITTLSSSSLGILDELTNSIGACNRANTKRGPIPLFQDSPARALLDKSPVASPSIYHEASSAVNSPLGFDHIQDSLQGMGLREISGNARWSSPLESPPYPSSLRNGRLRKSAQKARFNSEEYIDHIERELQFVKDAMHSPNTNRPWKEKLKQAKTENERLRKEINEMKAAFESEVQKTVERMSATEVELRRKIRSLEEELGNKNFTIQELDHQHDDRRVDQGIVETIKATVEKLEQEKSSLEEVNHSISKRNEVLTQLLVLSPTKAPDFDLASPIRNRRNGRPTSMMVPRMHSSPTTARIGSRPQSLVASPAMSATCYFSPGVMSTDYSTEELDEESQRQAGDYGSIDSGLGESCSVRSITGIGSRRSTNASQISVNPSSWGLPLAGSPSAEQSTVRQPFKRRARKFMPGSTQLKPLLLPVLTGENGALHSTSPVASPKLIQRREISEDSIDPTTTFLSKSPILSEYDHDIGACNNISQELTAEETTQIPCQSFDEVFIDDSSAEETSDFADENAEDSYIATWPSVDEVAASRAYGAIASDFPMENEVQSLMSSPGLGAANEDPEIVDLESTHHGFDAVRLDAEIGINTGTSQNSSFIVSQRKISETPSSVEVPQPLFSSAVQRNTVHEHFIGVPSNARDPCEAFPVPSSSPSFPRKRRKTSSPTDEIVFQVNYSPLHLIEKLQLNVDTRPILTPRSVAERAESPGFTSTRSTVSSRPFTRSRSPLEVLQQRSIGTRPLAMVTIQTIYGTLSRYTTYIKEMKRGPLALARRVVANAWHTNWAVMGKLSWWVLGLFLGPSSYRRDKPGWDWDRYDGESIANRFCGDQSCDDDRELLLQSSKSPVSSRHVRFEEQHDTYRIIGPRSPARPALKKTTSSWGQSLFLWGKFSVAIMLAVTGAVLKGPGEMLREVDTPRRCPRESARGREAVNDDHQSPLSTPHKDRPTGFNRPIFTSVDSDPERGRFDSRLQPNRCGRNNSTPSVTSNRRTPRSAYTAYSSQSSPFLAFNFHTGTDRDFSQPPVDHSWVDSEDADTLKPVRTERESLWGIFTSPIRGDREYDPESAGLGILNPQADFADDLDDPGGRDPSEIQNG